MLSDASLTDTSMIYEFKSRATGTIVMTEAVGHRVLEILGKDAGPRGIITVDQIPAAIAAIEAAVGEERMREAERAQLSGEGGGAFGQHSPEHPRTDAETDDHRDDPAARQKVSLAQRVFPFVEMLQAAHAAGKDVTWGV